MFCPWANTSGGICLLSLTSLLELNFSKSYQYINAIDSLWIWKFFLILVCINTVIFSLLGTCRGRKKKLIMRNGADGIFGITSPRRSEMHLFTWLCLHCDHLSGSLLTFNLLEDRQGLSRFALGIRWSEPPVRADVCLSSYLQSMHFLQSQKTFGYVISWVQEECGVCQI